MLNCGSFITKILRDIFEVIIIFNENKYFSDFIKVESGEIV